MSNSNNDEKNGKEIDHDLAKLVKEIFNSDGKVIQPTEEDLATEDQNYGPLRRIIIKTINDLFEFIRPQLIEVFEEILEEERRRNSSEQSASSS